MNENGRVEKAINLTVIWAHEISMSHDVNSIEFIQLEMKRGKMRILINILAAVFVTT